MDSQLLPVFVPPLAMLLAKAEKSKGGKLTSSEILKVRDQAVCIMMRPETARHMDLQRGYRDVNPENCWADWHRLRSQLTGNGYLPKLVLCIVGDQGFESRSRSILDEAGVEYEFRPPDSRMVTAFRASQRGLRSSLHEQNFNAIAHHQSVLYFLSNNFTAQKAASVALAFLRLGHKLLSEAGGIAIKCESSGVAHSRHEWERLAIAAESSHSVFTGPSSTAFWVAALTAYVQVPIESDTDFYTCGLHLLGIPDLTMNREVMIGTEAKDQNGTAQAHFFEDFALYLLAECVHGQFAPGHTFRADAAQNNLKATWEECTLYEEDDFFHNPFGIWRFENTCHK